MAQVGKIEFTSDELDQTRELLVYTPAFYDEYPLVNYDVIFMFDCNSREFLNFITSSVSFMSGGNKKYIVVGIIPTFIDSLNYGRNNDLLPLPVNVEEKDYFGGGGYYGNRDKFMNYLKNEIIPYIDANYRTGPRRIGIGPSLSASVSFTALRTISGYRTILNSIPIHSRRRDIGVHSPTV